MVKFGSKKVIFGVILVFFEGFGPCLGISHPTHPHLGEISQIKQFFCGGVFLSKNEVIVWRIHSVIIKGNIIVTFFSVHQCPPGGRALKFLFLGVAASQMRWSALSGNTILISEKPENCAFDSLLITQ